MTRHKGLFGCHIEGGEATGLSSVENKDAAQCSAVHKTASSLQQKKIIWPNMSIMPRLRDPILNQHCQKEFSMMIKIFYICTI